MQETWRERLVGRSAAIECVAGVIRLVGPRRTTVLITGETGTGKEVAARAIHAAGSRSAHPFVAINCSALPANLLEAELFGHTRGAFTGAVASRAGRFEMAHRGTIFLDEIGDMPLDLQAKLLRILQERELERLGSAETVKVDVRVIAATNVDLELRVKRGEFRSDLFYRLNVVPLRMPSLRERGEDIPLLADHFVRRICEQECLAPKSLMADAHKRLASYFWPGNVRQLENAVEMAVALTGERIELSAPDFLLPEAPAQDCSPAIALPAHGLDFEETISSIELSLLQQALERANGNKTRAADILHLNRTTLAAKLRSLAASV